VSSLAGKTALVTGAAKRIGREIALGLAAEGADCLVHYNRSAAHAAEVVDECRRRGVRSEAIATDLEDGDGTRALAERAVAERVDILVHNASTFDRLPFLDSAPEKHAEMLERDWAVHVQAPYLLSRIVGEHMVRNGWGRIVLIGDWSSEAAVYRNYAPYIVTKAAVPTLTKVLGPFVEPIELKINGTKSSIKIGQKITAEMTTHVSPVDPTQEQEVHVVVPTGFVFTDAQAAKNIRQIVNVDGLSFKDANTNAFYAPVEHSN